MTPERYQRVMALFEGACEREGQKRAAYLDASCAGDDVSVVALASELESRELEGREARIEF